MTDGRDGPSAGERAVFALRPDDRVYLKGCSRLRVGQDASRWFLRVGGLAGAAALYTWVVGRHRR